MASKLIRCEADSPDRCQGMLLGQHSQCPYTKVPGFDFCPMHAGAGIAADRKARLKHYQLGKWQARVEEFRSHEEMRNLRSEIGILQMTLETVINQCQDEHDLIMSSDKINSIVARIEKLIPLCAKMEEQAGITLDKNAVLQLADTIVQIMGDYLEDPDSKMELADRIISAVVDARPSSKD